MGQSAGAYPGDIVAMLRTQPEATKPPRHPAAKNLERARRLVAGDRPTALCALRRLDADAARARAGGPFCVTDKRRPAPGGDPHDYVSRGPYWWPNPTTADGLPWVRRDGERHPESEEFDRPRLQAMADAVAVLALHWALTGNDASAAHAVLLLRAWFLDERSRMNPHLEYGQGIPGICEGRGIGIIETAVLAEKLVPALYFLEDFPGWTADDHTALRDWFAAYLKWLVESGHGIAEARAINNHGTAYDLQVAQFAWYVGRCDIGRAVLWRVFARRVAVQVAPDGSQPLELARTRSLDYTHLNLLLLLQLAELGAALGVDLAGRTDGDGRGIAAALRWLGPYWRGERRWEHPQITPVRTDRPVELLLRAGVLYGCERLAALAGSDAGAGDPGTWLLYGPEEGS